MKVIVRTLLLLGSFWCSMSLYTYKTAINSKTWTPFKAIVSKSEVVLKTYGKKKEYELEIEILEKTKSGNGRKFILDREHYGMFPGTSDQKLIAEKYRAGDEVIAYANADMTSIALSNSPPLTPIKSSFVVGVLFLIAAFFLKIKYEVSFF